jgi:aminoglycoside 3-N-acetyltransferase
MTKTSIKDIEELIVGLGFQRKDRVMVHSSLFSLGIIENGVEGFHHALLNVIGEEGTIIVPTFTHSFRQGKVFNILETPSEKSLGMYAEYIRKLKGAVRSSDPLFSMAAFGPDAQELMIRTSINCFGKGSVYERLFEANVRYLALGITYSTGLSAFMHLERLANVPYRKELCLEGRSIDTDGKEFDDSAIHFARDENEFYQTGRTNREPMGAMLEEAGVSVAANFKNGRHFALSSKPFEEFVLNKLKDNPMIMFEIIK